MKQYVSTSKSVSMKCDFSLFEGEKYFKEFSDEDLIKVHCKKCKKIFVFEEKVLSMSIAYLAEKERKSLINLCLAKNVFHYKMLRKQVASKVKNTI